MYDVRIELRDLAIKAKALHLTERQISIESVLLVGELERRNVAVNLNMTTDQFVAYIELTPNQYWKRAQAARVIDAFPAALAMLQTGETQVSHLALVAPRITSANAEVLLAGIWNKSKREVEGFLSCVTSDGQLLEKEPEIELRVKLTKSQIELLDRCREVLGHGGHIPDLSEILVKALGDLLEKRDPLRQAARAATRRERAGVPSPGKETGESSLETPRRPSPGKKTSGGRQKVPTAVKHAVWLRDGGQCTWSGPEGRCPERLMLELDHIKMWCRGGRHCEENLRLRCRRHNQFAAEREPGVAFMARARAMGASPGQLRGTV